MRTKAPYRNSALWLVVPCLVLLLFSFAIPIVAVVNYSVHDVFSGNTFVWAGGYWYEHVLSSSTFWDTLGRTFLYAVLVIAIEIPLGVWIALHIPRAGRQSSFFIIVAAIPLLIPWFIVGLVWKIIADPAIGPLGVSAVALGTFYDLNSPIIAWAVIILADIWHWTGLVVLLSYAALVAIPRAYYQAAQVDGASRGAIFRFVELPRLKRVLIIALLLRMVDGLMIYIEPFMITRGGPGVSTTFLSQDLIQTAMKEFDFGEASAAALIYLLIMLALSWALFRIMTAADD
ncbi:MAG: sugar ABC transporter permease [Pseudomonadota bacterium]